MCSRHHICKPITPKLLHVGGKSGAGAEPGPWRSAGEEKPSRSRRALTIAKAGKNASKLRWIVNAFLTLRAVTLGLKSRTGCRGRPRAASCLLVESEDRSIWGLERCGERRIRDIWPTFAREIGPFAPGLPREIRVRGGTPTRANVAPGFSHRNSLARFRGAMGPSTFNMPVLRLRLCGGVA